MPFKSLFCWKPAFRCLWTTKGDNVSQASFIFDPGENDECIMWYVYEPVFSTWIEQDITEPGVPSVRPLWLLLQSQVRTFLALPCKWTLSRKTNVGEKGHKAIVTIKRMSDNWMNLMLRMRQSYSWDTVSFIHCVQLEIDAFPPLRATTDHWWTFCLTVWHRKKGLMMLPMKANNRVQTASSGKPFI